MVRKTWLLISAAALVSCGGESQTYVTVAVEPALRQAEPALFAKLDAMAGLGLAEPGQPGAQMRLAAAEEGALLAFDRMSVLSDRRDPAFADSIDLGAVDKQALATLIAARILASDLAASTEDDDQAKVEALRGLAEQLPGLISKANPLSPLGEDLRTSYRQAMFQIASETRAKGDIDAITAFEKAEAKQALGVDGDDRYDRSRAWYYFASADHLRADLSLENEIAQAFSGFKDAQRPFQQDREVQRQTLRSDQELVAARVRVGQLLHAIGTLRESDKLLGEAEFAFKSSAGFWFDATGSEAPFCFQVALGQADSIRCLTQEDAVLPDLVSD